jgi:lipid-binding SYLF domain-containing protein
MGTIRSNRSNASEQAADLHSKGSEMKARLALLAIAVCLASPPLTAQVFSWDPLKDVQEVLPEGTPNEGKIIQARQQVREMAQDALASLYEIAPGTHRAVDRAAGYAVFSTFGVKLFFAGGTTGKGMVVNKRTGRQTFMDMVQVQGGLGFGVNKNRLIFVFTNEQALRNFIDQGWSFGGQANVSAMAGGQGSMFSGAAAVSPGVYLYQLTETGLSATLTVSGTKFFKDPDMN